MKISKREIEGLNSRLNKVSCRAESRITFITNYKEVYKMPVNKTKRNINQLKKLQYAISFINQFDFKLIGCIS